jgi:DNA-binding CsgD family transcriptional regulator
MPSDNETTPDDPVFFTPSERRYLWLLSQGHTTAETQRLMGINRNPTLGTRIREKLGTLTTAQALFLAGERGLIGPRLECGTPQGYRHHKALGEDPCRACRREFSEYCERHSTPVLAQVTLTEAEMRLLRALDAGRRWKQIATNWQCSTRTLDTVRASLYRKLDVAHLPWRLRKEAALQEGRRLGYLMPDSFLAPERRSRWYTTDLTDLQVRTLVAVSEGRSLSQAGQLLGGIPGSSVSSRLAIIYRKLDVLAYGHGERREAALKEARNRGYPV